MGLIVLMLTTLLPLSGDQGWPYDLQPLELLAGEWSETLNLVLPSDRWEGVLGDTHLFLSFFH